MTSTALGTLYLDVHAGRALRRRCGDVLRGQIIYASGSFRAGDSVHVAFRSKDGAQYVVAAGTACCDVDNVAYAAHRPEAAGSTTAGDDGQRVVIRVGDLRLLWPTAAL